MKKLLLLACLLFSCTKPKLEIVKEIEIPTPIVDENKECQEITIDGKNVKVVLSNAWEALAPTTGSIDIAAMHNQSTALLVVSTQEFTGTYDEYVLHSLRVLRNKEISIDDFTSFKIDETNFLITDTTKDELHVWHFFGVNDKLGYTISCGGKNNSMINDVCHQAVGQIKFK